MIVGSDARWIARAMYEFQMGNDPRIENPAIVRVGPGNAVAMGKFRLYNGLEPIHYFLDTRQWAEQRFIISRKDLWSAEVLYHDVERVIGSPSAWDNIATWYAITEFEGDADEYLRDLLILRLGVPK